MDAKQARLITSRLIPFVMREQGRGFAMDRFLDKLPPGTSCFGDNTFRTIPKCGTVGCIAGSTALLVAPPKSRRHPANIARKALGLTPKQAYALFYGWICSGYEPQNCWPKKFRRAYFKAKTTRGKASVACRLLELVAHTRGKCLDPIKKKARSR